MTGGVHMHSFAIDVKGGEQKNIAINNKGGDFWTQIVIDVNMAIFEEQKEPRGAEQRTQTTIATTD